ncbi:MAG TPA: ATP-binding protein [Verrucomicrobiae bacterium]|jgi:PAS domain S-box-containing protein|nr:ATP-binding protein [Verrucomicrobiae bacterium]
MPSKKLAQFSEKAECLQMLAEEIPDFAVIGLDPAGRIVEWNLGAERLLGWAEAEALGQEASIIFTPSDRARGEPQKEIGTAAERGSAKDERWHLRKDGTVFWGSGSMTAIHSEDGAVAGFIKIFRDFTDYRTLAESLKKSNRDLEQFAHTVSHDLQEPLRVVALYADLLKRRAGADAGAEMKQFLDFIYEAAARAQNLTQSLLNLAKFGATPPRLQAVNLATIVEATLHNMQARLREKKAVVLTEPLPMVTADSLQIGQLFQNLISNALKYNDSPSPEIRIEMEEKELEWQIAVKDNGMGIRKEDRGKIFEAFTQLGMAVQGSGLGLAICKKIVERHGGRIWVEAHSPKGSAFFFTLPKVRPSGAS